jgi:hypothetical protein
MIFIFSDHCATSLRKFTKLFGQQENNEAAQELGVQVQGIVSHFKLAYLGLSALSK